MKMNFHQIPHLHDNETVAFQILIDMLLNFLLL